MVAGRLDPSLERFAASVVEARADYDFDVLDMLYAEDLSALVVSPDGSVERVSREEALAALAARGRWDETSPPDAYRMLHLEQQGSDGVALLRCVMDFAERPVLLELRFRRYSQGWLVIGETVTPWPNPDADASARDGSSATDRQVPGQPRSAGPAEAGQLQRRAPFLRDRSFP